MMHRHSCSACCANGRATIFVTAGEPHEGDETHGGGQLVSSSARSNLPLVAIGAANAHPHLQHLMHPCGCSLHESLCLHPHHHNLQSFSHNMAPCLPSAIHTVDHTTANQLVQAPESLRIELPAACAHISHGHNHAHIVHAHSHHHQRPLALAEPIKSLDLVRKFGSDYMSGSVQMLALNNSGKVLDAQPLAICRSIAPTCDKQLPAATSKAMYTEPVCCAGHMRILPRCSHIDADDSHRQTSVMDRCQIHPNCVAPINPHSAFKAQPMPAEACRTPPPLQVPTKAGVTAPPAYDNTVFMNHRKDVTFASNGAQKEDDFWTGPTDKMQGGDDGHISKGVGRGYSGNGWRGGCNSRGRGGFNNHSSSWNCSEDNGGNDDLWKSAEPAGTGNGRGGRGRGCGRGRGGRGGGWQPNKRKREGDGDDWEGSKPTKVAGERSMVEGSGWGNSNNGNDWGNPSGNAVSGW
ncbi:hypothetical protein GOP47_0015132 [Adiantum capillus-veneris]|uniref:Uncharacterized protein n=1 Tax=Adiantum capillus-veneris TaxID=13818 RepID=A0A9D4UMT3_ADICA|nr:hypothetical protein GOP47_0015132 [Adiantum capillus-veneris]